MSEMTIADAHHIGAITFEAAEVQKLIQNLPFTEKVWFALHSVPFSIEQMNHSL